MHRRRLYTAVELEKVAGMRPSSSETTTRRRSKLEGRGGSPVCVDGKTGVRWPVERRRRRSDARRCAAVRGRTGRDEAVRQRNGRRRRAGMRRGSEMRRRNGRRRRAGGDRRRGRAAAPPCPTVNRPSQDGSVATRVRRAGASPSPIGSKTKKKNLQSTKKNHRHTH